MNTTRQENQQNGRLLRRSLDRRILGGVAAGLARYFGSHLSRLAVGFLSEKLVMG
jgi:phage shock protein PspC (stress-responsive transcriptional regulator)